MVGTMASGQLEPDDFQGLTGDETVASQDALSYRELSTAFSEIRLLTLYGLSDDESSIECTLQYANLDDVPDYTALSYVWGDATVTEDILVNECSFSATINLVSALRHIRKLDGEIVLWVDAICELTS